MSEFRHAFIDLCLTLDVLRFGRFELKSGRISPYFFNAGLFRSGVALRDLGRYYARAIDEAGLDFDMLFGPAYKGIPLASAIAIAFADLFKRDVPFAFNRKEIKDHGEGGQLVGAPLQGRVLVVDDVISAGTSMRESAQLIAANGASLAGLAIALDRQERGAHDAEGARTAVAEISRELGVRTVSIITLDDLIGHLPATDSDLRARLTDYRTRYGADGLAIE